ncbi:putative phenylalanine--tRNA ligase [Helianthus annuus]|uniref:phenylalanine--tRNA ligase alpha subunit, cytoplasmic n=1 Tax=Helianthus annuus TaxID=4232 RepID=UPI000B8FF608|nr:phenylalanine--tRNA ligase alpha subunit, cytoplasmic [Helianthus annuus]XP_035834488.1 phenylalanine--tRNA ligase alpha subunit, cytoplasmic [Helianthus annuus]XP_035834489.1 phenylalanine--tRNA ligase alpha subunit, cytoplasmic [Helianthus annuus]XP_035834490.1 phenylalanine--tRNA ligase alpha subunit, cytoplasmic [Helianthus annuus]XP_035834491.1 phenylalanine--tRNA ligase alpha subunit, cytoplasmic [Helianthus annuus]XP_035834492.1 phenylalanine--tRNA ligase alpha subunit, cytoplasmic [
MLIPTKDSENTITEAENALHQNGTLVLMKPFEAKRYYSIDRVFRNVAVDRTHLAEFHQIEGLICDRGLSLGDLQGVLLDFFSCLGMSKLHFKPAYNPYTEPSMEIFGLKEMG